MTETGVWGDRPDSLRKTFCRAFALLLVLSAMGCGGFAARRMVQAPNTYPKWLAPAAPVTMAFETTLLTVFESQYVHIPRPEARIRYRIIDPADYQFRWTNHIDDATGQFNLNFSADVSKRQDRTNRWTHEPRGVVILLHGYGVSGFAMLPWAFLLAQEGWRCVLVDLRGHGKSTGRQIHFGIQEARDLSALLDQLCRAGRATTPVAVIGHSFGAVVALRWKLSDARVGKIVAMSPYAELPSAIRSISAEYAPWIPDFVLDAGISRLPDLLDVEWCQLNPDCWPEGAALFVAGEKDRIAPVNEVKRLFDRSGDGSRLLVVPNAPHEPLPFYLEELREPVVQWLSNTLPLSQAGMIKNAK